MAKKRIAILYLGGSIGMKRNDRSGKLYSIESVDEIYKHMPRVQTDVTLSYFTLNAVGSSDITPEHWHELLHVLHTQYEQVDGFVVIHGTNTMAYTAAAVAFGLQGLNKPIVFTGALLPLNSPLGDGSFNLQHAILTACSNIAEVCIVMDARVYRGVRAHKVKHSMFHSFYSPHLLPISDIHSLPAVADFTLLRRDRTLEYAPDFESNIVSIQLFPGFSEQILYTILQARPAGIVLHAYGQGMVSNALLPWFKQAKEEGVAVVLVSQAKEGAINMHSFEKQEQFERLGAISAKNMTPECATVKFMWALKHFTRFDHLKNFMERSIVGELD